MGGALGIATFGSIGVAIYRGVLGAARDAFVRGIVRYERRRFRQADGTVLERWTGPAFVHVAGRRTTDDVVFGEPGDLVLLGSRTLEGLNVRVEPVTKQLVDAGPAPAAAV